MPIAFCSHFGSWMKSYTTNAECVSLSEKEEDEGNITINER